MTIDLIELKALATAAKHNQYDAVALNDYGMAMEPAVTLELIAEIERRRQVEAEGCKPDSSILLFGLPGAGAAPCRSLDKAEGEQPDLNTPEAEQDQATPVAWVIFDNGFIDDHTTDKDLAAGWHEQGFAVSALYDHADSGEVERLRAQLADLKRRHDGLHRDMATIAGREVPKGCTVADYAAAAIADALSASAKPSTSTSELTDVLPSVAVEGDQLVIRITTECLLHAITCAPEWPIDYKGNPISIQSGTLLIQEIIHELQREDEQGTNQMHRLFDQAALDAINNGSEAVSYD